MSQKDRAPVLALTSAMVLHVMGNIAHRSGKDFGPSAATDRSEVNDSIGCARISLGRRDGHRCDTQVVFG